MARDERAVRGGRLEVAPDAEALARLAAHHFRAAAAGAVRRGGRFAVALAGGSTPRALYAELARSAAAPEPAVDWSRARVFWGDERCVPPDHPDSNYRMARETLLDQVAIPRDRIHRMRGEDADPDRAAALYEAELRAALGASEEAVPGIPRLDLVLLGLGPDAHTASLFPGSPALEETVRLVAAPFVAKLNARRLTLTPPALNAALRVMFLVSGSGKAAPLRDVLEGEVRPDVHPAQCVRPSSGTVLWLADAAAASLLRR